jgi:hypothetical protein
LWKRLVWVKESRMVGWVGRPSKFPAITMKFPHFCLLSRITHEVTFLPTFFKLNLWRFLPVGQLPPFLLICTMSNAFFLPTPVEEVLKMCVSIAYKKRQKNWKMPEEHYFCRLGRRSDVNISYFYGMNK